MRVRHFLVAWAVLTLGGLMAACSSSPAAENTPTPQYVVITNTPRVTPTTAPVEAAVVPLDAPFMCKAQVVEQTYENGYMFWVGASSEERCKTQHTFEPESGEIWVAILGEDGRVGDWLIFPDTFDEEVDPESDPALEPDDPDLIQPIRGFGKVWREQLSNRQRRALGYATAGEFLFVTDYRYDPGGFLNDEDEFVPRPGIHTILALGGERLLYDEQSKLVFAISGD
jgi:hypothetical protein